MQEAMGETKVHLIMLDQRWMGAEQWCGSP
jgi:hypothetical protein